MSTPLTRATLAAAFAGAVALMGAPTTAEAASVKCYGIAKAGENGCANAAGTTGCAGSATSDYDGGDWKTVESKEACEAAHGKTEPFTGRNPDIK